MRTVGMAVWTVALAITVGCSNGNRDRDDSNAGTAGTSGATPEATANANDPSTMTVTGCLQQGRWRPAAEIRARQFRRNSGKRQRARIGSAAGPMTFATGLDTRCGSPENSKIAAGSNRALRTEK
jgi:hypothetical protein